MVEAMEDSGVICGVCEIGGWDEESLRGEKREEKAK
jgi:hypothetical protein